MASGTPGETFAGSGIFLEEVGVVVVSLRLCIEIQAGLYECAWGVPAENDNAHHQLPSQCGKSENGVVSVFRIYFSLWYLSPFLQL